MASTYSTNLAIELIGTGDQAGSWGNTTNTNLGTLIEQAISGYVTQAVSTGTDTTITIPNGATGVARNMYIELTGTGGTNTNLIVPANKKLYFIFNNSTGAVTVKVSGQTGISVPNGKKMILVSNGTDIVTAENYVASLSSDNLSLTGTLAVGSTSTFTGAATFTANPTLSGGTANGVLYLNGSKVATSGTALTFDGTNVDFGTVGAKLNFPTTSSSTKNYVGGAADGFSLEMVTQRGAIQPISYKQDYSVGHVWSLTGTGAMALTSTGLGIGTASPSTKLHVVNDTAATNSAVDVLTLTQSSTGTAASGLGAGILFQSERPSGGVVLKRGAIYGVAGATDPNDDGDLAFYTLTDTGPSGFTEKMRLDSSGNLGIGTASPGYKLQVNGASSGIVANIGYNGDTGTGLYVGVDHANSLVQLYASGSTSKSMVFYTGNSEVMRYNNSGNLGIGTSTTTNGRLNVQAGTAATGNSAFFTNLDGTYNSYLQIQHSSAGVKLFNGNSFGAAANNLIFGNSGVSETMRLDGSGNLGLGVTPSAWDAGFQVLENSGGSYSSGSSGAIRLLQNGYYGSSAYRYKFSSILASRYEMNSGAHQWYISTDPTPTAGNTISFTQAMTLDASGNLGIGTTSPTFVAGGGIHIENSTASALHLTDISSGSTSTDGAFFAFDNPNLYIQNKENGFMVFETNATERARITSGGDFLVGTTATGLQTVRSMGFQVNAGCTQFISHSTADGSGDPYVEFGYNGTKIGSITQNGTTAVAYNTTSDYRLKTFISPVTGAGARLDALKPVEYEWKADGKLARGFFAHEFQQVYADSVTGEKDAVDAAGKPVYQAMQASTTEVIADLVAEIQSLRQRVAALEAK